VLLESIDAPVRSFIFPIAHRKARDQLRGRHGVAVGAKK
jgi:DNA-directed RNA polymerase specialized sigma24 family protein